MSRSNALLIATLILFSFGCTSSETKQAICGNATLEAAESCDDGNTTPLDGCSATCTVEAGYGCDNISMPSTCSPLCIPACEGLECGDDGCGGSCGRCDSTLTCSPTGECVPPDSECAPGCWDSQLSDGTCQPACFVESCQFDTAGDQPTDCPTCESAGMHTDCSGSCITDDEVLYMYDPFCDDGAFGIDLFCEEYAWDRGACGPPPTCDGVTCNVPPPPRCDGNETLTYAALGTCDEGLCTYEETRSACQAGEACHQGVCYEANDPCVVNNVVCDPPVPTCSEDATVALYYTGPGLCFEGSCLWDAVEVQTPCGANQTCDNGQCVDLPPLTLCGGQVDNVGNQVCEDANNNSECLWDGGDCCQSTTPSFDCTLGCDCKDPTAPEKDPCYQVSCGTPPEGSCSGNTPQIYQPSGQCMDGSCIYSLDESASAACGANATCTVVQDFCAGEACATARCIPSDNPCAGVACTNPPTGLCNGRRAAGFESVGACTAGTCSYAATLKICTDEELCIDGACYAYFDALYPDCPAQDDSDVQPANGICDAVLNTEACGFDGGDCCYSTCDFGPCDFDVFDCQDTDAFETTGGSCTPDTVHQDCPPGFLCLDGSCAVPSPQNLYPECPIDLSSLERPGNQRCEPSLNLPECGFDGNDCCPSTNAMCRQHWAERPFNLATCVGAGGNSSFLGGGLCTTANDNEACNFDLGDCLELCVCNDPSAWENDPCFTESILCDNGASRTMCDDNDTVTKTQTGMCRFGTCLESETSRQPCENGLICSDGICLEPSDPCAGVQCGIPSPPMCDGHVAVRAQAGQCEDGACVFETLREDCGMGIWGTCRDGACVPLETEVVVELTTDTWGYETSWQLLTADGQGLFASFGLDGSTTYNHAFMVTPGDYCIRIFDDYEDGGAYGTVTAGGLPAASWGASDYTNLMELCFTVEPPAEFSDITDSGDVCTAAGGLLETVRNQICDAANNIEVCAWDGGDCCGETNRFCFDTTDTSCQCLDPVHNDCWAYCQEAPSSYCDGARVVEYMTPGGCIEGTCIFEKANRACPGITQCESGACVAGDAETLFPACNGHLDFVADGYCDPRNNVASCGFDGGDCCDQTCMSGDWLCGQAGYACQDPAVMEQACTYAVDCTDPPQASCSGNQLIQYRSQGDCQDGACYYAIETYTDCGDQTCHLGRCRPADDTCLETTCDTPPADRCEGQLAIGYQADGCSDGECSYPEARSLCGLGIYHQCEDGQCKPVDNALAVAVTHDEAASESHWILSNQLDGTSMPLTTVEGSQVTLNQPVDLQAGTYCLSGRVYGGSASGSISLGDTSLATWQTTDKLSEVVDLSGTWAGEYNCLGMKGVKIGLKHDLATQSLLGTFEYFTNNTYEAKLGKFAVTGSYNPAERTFAWVPERWIDEPASGSMVGANGTFIPETDELDGFIDSIVCSVLYLDPISPAKHTVTDYEVCFDVPQTTTDQSLACVAAGGDLESFGDGVCTAANNQEACAWDGGDCCRDTNPSCFLDGTCSCQDPYAEVCPNDCYIPPAGYCSGNTAYSYSSGTCTEVGCSFEMTVTDCQVGDVCLEGACVEDTLQNRYPDCLSPSLDIAFGDGICLVGLNSEACGYDGGDCCATTNPACMTSSTGCACLDPEAPENDPCYQVTCYEQPRPSCDQNDSLTYDNFGTCVDGTCQYPVASRTPCDDEVCSMGQCLDALDPCAGVSCEQPPTDYCEGSRAHSYGPYGTCEAGGCTYTSTSELCSVGCDNAACIPYAVTLTTTTGPYSGDMSVSIFEGSTLLRHLSGFPYNSTQTFQLDVGPGDYCAHFTDGLGEQGLLGTVVMGGSIVGGWTSADYTSDEGCIGTYTNCSGSTCFTIERAVVDEGPVECTANQFEDCDGSCASLSYQSWQGDGHCDDGSMLVNLNCEAFDFDGGDCN